MDENIIFKSNITDDKGNPLVSRVYERPYTNKQGKTMKFKMFSIFKPFQYMAKFDAPEKGVKLGDTIWGQDYKITLNRLQDVLKLLLEIDMKFNDGKAFEALGLRINRPSQPAYDVDSDIPF